VQALTPPDHRARVVYGHWLLAKCIVNPRCVANILFTDEAGFTRDGIVNFKFQFGTINLDYLKPMLCHKFKRLLRQCKSGRYTNLSVQTTCFTGWSYPYQPSLSWTQQVHWRPLNTRNNYKPITESTLL
jgi:hypothetical protein